MLNRVMLRKIENISESTPEIGLAPKFNRFWRVTPCPCLPSLVHIHQHVRELSCGQTDTQTYTHRVKDHGAPGEVHHPTLRRFFRTTSTTVVFIHENKAI